MWGDGEWGKMGNLLRWGMGKRGMVICKLGRWGSPGGMGKMRTWGK